MRRLMSSACCSMTCGAKWPVSVCLSDMTGFLAARSSAIAGRHCPRDRIHQLLVAEGFHHRGHVDLPDEPGATARGRIVVAGDEYDRKPRSLMTKPFAQLEPAQTRQPHVQNEAVHLGRMLVERLGGIEQVHLVPHRTKQPVQSGAHISVVL